MTIKGDIEVVWRKVALIQRFSSVLYPFDIFELLTQLPTIGYVVPELSLTVAREANRPIAQKGDTELAINQDNKTIGVVGRKVEKTIELFKELQKFYSERMDPSSGLETQYIELDAEGWAKSGNSPISSFTSFWSEYKPLEELGQILGDDTVNFGVNLVPANKDPNSAEYFHITITPLIPSATKRYQFRFIKRGADLQQMLDRFSKTEDTLRKIIGKIEV